MSKHITRPATKDQVLQNVRRWRRDHRKEITYHPSIDPHFNINIGEKLEGMRYGRRN